MIAETIQLNAPQTPYRRREDSQWSPFAVDLSADQAQREAEHVGRARRKLSPAFRRIFDGALVEAHERLVAAPGDPLVKIRFVTLYHLILESTLGLTTFKFVTDYLERESLLPGFVAGYSKIHHDETRHIGYGVWFLREAVREHPDSAEAIRETLRDLLPSVAESLTPPAAGGESRADALGVTSEEIREFALGGLTRRLDIIGVPLGTI